MNILLIDGYRLFSESLKDTLIQKPGVDTVYISNEIGFKNERYLSSVDIVICDMNEPRMSGFAVIEYLRIYLKKGIKIIVLSGLTDLQTIKQAIKLGADAFVSKNTDLGDLLEAISEVGQGKSFISKGLRVGLMGSAGQEEKLNQQLTRREKEILQELCSGRKTVDIAEQLGLSLNTIQYYQRNLMRKLKVSRIVDLIVYALQNGLYAYPSRKETAG